MFELRQACFNTATDTLLLFLVFFHRTAAVKSYLNGLRLSPVSQCGGVVSVAPTCFLTLQIDLQIKYVSGSSQDHVLLRTQSTVNVRENKFVHIKLCTILSH